MKKILKYVLAIGVVLAAGYFLLAMVLNSAPLDANTNTKVPTLPEPKPVITSRNQNSIFTQLQNTNQSVVAVKNVSQVVMTVPYISEAPDNVWTGPWKNACEEASIVMVDKYYYGKSAVTISEAKKEMTMLFNVQNKIWGGNANSDAMRTAQLINDNTIYNAVIIDSPTISQIKKELQQNRPVITPLYGFDLHNENIPFVPAPRGTSYHMFVIIGYDDIKKEFITNDSGDTIDGVSHRYSYDVVMNALHDYSFVTKHADGPARAIFTYPKLVKTAASPKIYYLHDSVKQWVFDEMTFKAKDWTWDMVNLVDNTWLNSFKLGSDIKL
jgi:hypothetical protein